MRRGLAITFAALAVLGTVVVFRITSEEEAARPSKPSTAADNVDPASKEASGPQALARQGTPRPPVEVKANDVQRIFTGQGRANFQRMSPTRQSRVMAELLDSEKVVLDPKATLDSRLQSLTRLADHEAISRECALAMSDLLNSAPERSIIRAGVCTQLKGRSDLPEVQNALVARLLTDPNVMVRKRAAQGLAPVANDPRIRAYLEQAYRSDTSEFAKVAIADALHPHPRPEPRTPTPPPQK